MSDTSQNTELEAQVLREAIVSATGLNMQTLQIGIKGDPSLRETAMERVRYASLVDGICEKLQASLQELLLNRGTYQVFIGFNNAEIRTRSVFDPLREEIHSAEKLVEAGYLDRHFPLLPFDEKVTAMREIYERLYASQLFQHLPNYWQRIVRKRHDVWRPMDHEEIIVILSTLKALRETPEYYLRNVMVSIVQSVVRMQFNCDGTQIVKAKDFQRFIEDNLP